jgi:hypothetical protein
MRREAAEIFLGTLVVAACVGEAVHIVAGAL